MITGDAISLQVNPLQCGYFSQLIREDGEAVISQIDAGQMLHFCHGVRQFGEDIASQVQFWVNWGDTTLVRSTAYIKTMFAWRSCPRITRIIYYLSAEWRLRRTCWKGPSSRCQPTWQCGCCPRHSSGPWTHHPGRIWACNWTDLQRGRNIIIKWVCINVTGAIMDNKDSRLWLFTPLSPPAGQHLKQHQPEY